MVQTLDFFVCGMPRGGTSAMARYLSAVKGMHCGQEVFPVRANHAELNVPEAFLTQHAQRWNDSSVAEINERGDEIAVWGNKTPTYFYRLKEIEDELGGAPSVVCIRAIGSVAASYSTRASAPKDRWHHGRHGIFAIGDALMLAHVLAEHPTPEKVLVMPQQGLLKDWKEATRLAVEHVAPGHPLEFRPKALDEIEKIKTRQQSRRKAELSGVETAALSRLERTGLTAFFDSDRVVPLTEVQDDLRKILADCPPYPIGFMRRMTSKHEREDAQEYFEKWAAMPARTIARLKNRKEAMILGS